MFEKYSEHERVKNERGRDEDVLETAEGVELNERRRHFN